MSAIANVDTIEQNPDDLKLFYSEMMDKERIEFSDYQGLHYAPPISPEQLAELKQMRVTSIPGVATYRPLLIPSTISESTYNWSADLQPLMHSSAYAFIGELWATQLIHRKDRIESPTWMFWNDMIPKPNALTCLFWLLTCESWPWQRDQWEHIAHEGATPSQFTDLFARPNIVMPMSPDLVHLGVKPIGFGYSPTRINPFVVDGRQPPREAFNTHVTREDRKRLHAYMASGLSTCASIYRDGQGFKAPSRLFDERHAIYEVEESHDKIQCLELLRRTVMMSLLTPPGIPSYHLNLREQPGCALYTWASHGVAVISFTSAYDDDLTVPFAKLRYWTQNGDNIRFTANVSIATVPYLTPRVWFGWDDSGESQMDWINAYLYYRPLALRMLFAPRGFNLSEAIDRHIAIRTHRLGKTGTIAKSAEAFDAFKAAVGTLNLNW